MLAWGRWGWRWEGRRRAEGRGLVFAEHVPIGGEADADFGEFFFGGAAAGATVVLVLLLLFGAEDLEDGLVARLAGAERGAVAGEAFEFHGRIEVR